MSRDYYITNSDGTAVIGYGSTDDIDSLCVPPEGVLYAGALPDNLSLCCKKPDRGYSADRILEYPSIGDQLDALWKLIKANADKIDLTEAAPLLEAVQAVKDKYPKPPTNDIN